MPVNGFNMANTDFDEKTDEQTLLDKQAKVSEASNRNLTNT